MIWFHKQKLNQVILWGIHGIPAFIEREMIAKGCLPVFYTWINGRAFYFPMDYIYYTYWDEIDRKFKYLSEYAVDLTSFAEGSWEE